MESYQDAAVGGLVPWWSQRPKSIKLSTFNARIEAIATSRVYREALEKRRCAICTA